MVQNLQPLLFPIMRLLKKFQFLGNHFVNSLIARGKGKEGGRQGGKEGGSKRESHMCLYLEFAPSCQEGYSFTQDCTQQQISREDILVPGE